MFTLDHTTSDIVVVVSLNYRYVHIRFSRERPCRWSMTWPIEMLIFCENSLSLRFWWTTLSTWTEASLERLDLKKMDVCYLPQFLKGFFLEQGKIRLWFSCHTYPEVEEKSSQIEIRKICFLQNRLELHQPNMHIGYRVIPISVHILSLARISWILTHSLQRNSFVAGYSDDEWVFVKVSSLQPTCYRLWHM